jgi:peptide/nickel transport system substrate-binding protein
MKSTLPLLFSLLLAGPAFGQHLTIGARAEITMDPHHQWLASNISYYRQIYGTLTALDPDAQARPMLADFRMVNELSWEFKLKPGAKFHNGRPVSAQDVVASLNRAKTLPNAAASYAGALQTITEIKAADAQTVLINTERPNGNIPQQLTQVAIIPKEVADSATRDDFTSGKAAIGAGAYKVVRYRPGDRLELARADGTVGAKPHWATVTYRFIADDAARLAALIGGDVDLIDYVPPADMARLQNDKRLAVHTRASDRVMYLIPDSSRDRSPFVTDLDGKPLDKNPLKDLRVRKAMSLAIDRDALVRSVMDGAAAVASQTVPPGFSGYSSSIGAPAHDLNEAKQLLANAGYPKGFALTIHCTNDRYVNDARTCQAIGQMLSRLGLKMNVVTQPKAVFFTQMTNHAGDRGSLLLLAWGSAWTGDASGILNQTLHSYDKAKGLGTWNLGHYTNAQVDNMVGLSNVTVERERKGRFQAVALKAAMEDYAQIPLIVLRVINASKREIAFTPYADEATLATAALPAGVRPNPATATATK